MLFLEEVGYENLAQQHSWKKTREAQRVLMEKRKGIYLHTRNDILGYERSVHFHWASWRARHSENSEYTHYSSLDFCDRVFVKEDPS